MKTSVWSIDIFLAFAVILRSSECTISAWSKPVISTPSGNGVLVEKINDCVTTGTATGITITATGTSISAYTKVSQTPANPELAIDSKGVVTVTSGTVSYSSAASFTLVISANDTDSTATATVTLNVNAAPAIAPHVRSVCIQDTSATGVKLIDLTATDANSGTAITWTIASGNTGTAFAITAGSIAVAKTLHMATTASYTLVITAADDSSTHLTSTTTLTATVQTTCPSSTSASANLTASAQSTCPRSKPGPTTITASVQTTRSNKAASVAISLVTVLTAFLVKGLC